MKINIIDCSEKNNELIKQTINHENKKENYHHFYFYGKSNLIYEIVINFINGEVIVILNEKNYFLKFDKNNGSSIFSSFRFSKNDLEQNFVYNCFNENQILRIVIQREKLSNGLYNNYSACFYDGVTLHFEIIFDNLVKCINIFNNSNLDKIYNFENGELKKYGFNNFISVKQSKKIFYGGRMRKVENYLFLSNGIIYTLNELNKKEELSKKDKELSKKDKELNKKEELSKEDKEELSKKDKVIIKIYNNYFSNELENKTKRRKLLVEY